MRARVAALVQRASDALHSVVERVLPQSALRQVPEGAAHPVVTLSPVARAMVDAGLQATRPAPPEAPASTAPLDRGSLAARMHRLRSE